MLSTVLQNDLRSRIPLIRGTLPLLSNGTQNIHRRNNTVQILVDCNNSLFIRGEIYCRNRANKCFCLKEKIPDAARLFFHESFNTI